MTYCRTCGTEIAFKRTKNDKWLPCNLYTGEPHFCKEGKDSKKINSGLNACDICGKPIFINKHKEGRKNILTKIDYATLTEHVCKKIDITNFNKYKNRISKTKKS